MSISTVPTEQLPPDTNAGPGVMAELYLTMVLSVVAVAMRACVRLRITGHWGWDDTTIIISTIFLLIGTVLLTLEIQLGIGRHLVYLPNPQESALGILKYNTFFQMANVLCTLFTKISIAFYILRIKDSKTLRILFAVMMTFMVLATLAIIITLSIACIPTEALWNPAIKGKCLKLQDVYSVAYVQSGFTIVVDLALTASPIIILWNVKIHKGRKSLIVVLLSLGLTATVCNALRSAFMPDLTADDYSYGITPITIVAILEMAAGIIAASIPACMPLFIHLKSVAKSTTPYHFSPSTRGTSELPIHAPPTDEIPLEHTYTEVFAQKMPRRFTMTSNA